MSGNYSNALCLISTYESDSDSEDEIESQPVLLKRRLEEFDDNPTKKLKCGESTKLPLPSIFSSATVEEDTQESDQSELHKGRIRSFPHERGNWATYVYVPYEHNDVIEELIGTIISNCKHEVTMEPCEDLHISVTKTVILKHHWINSFISTITNRVSHIGQFLILFDTLQVYCNEERTRTFLGLCIKSGRDTLVNIVDALNKGLTEFNLPTFYNDPSFHMSIAWSVGDHEELYNTFLDKFNDILSHFMIAYPQFYWYIHVKQLQCKTGNKMFNLNLAQNFA